MVNMISIFFYLILNSTKTRIVKLSSSSSSLLVYKKNIDFRCMYIHIVHLIKFFSRTSFHSMMSHSVENFMPNFICVMTINCCTIPFVGGKMWKLSLIFLSHKTLCEREKSYATAYNKIQFIEWNKFWNSLIS